MSSSLWAVQCHCCDSVYMLLVNLSGVNDGGAERTLSNGIFAMFSRWSLHLSQIEATHCVWNQHSRRNDMLRVMLWNSSGFSYCATVNAECWDIFNCMVHWQCKLIFCSELQVYKLSLSLSGWLLRAICFKDKSFSVITLSAFSTLLLYWTFWDLSFHAQRCMVNLSLMYLKLPTNSSLTALILWITVTGLL